MPAIRPALPVGSVSPNSYVVEVRPGSYRAASSGVRRSAGTAAYVIVVGQAWPISTWVQPTYPTARRTCACRSPADASAHGAPARPCPTAVAMSSCQYGWNSTSSTRWPYRSWVRSFGGFSFATRPHSSACSLPATRPRSARDASVAWSACRTQASARTASPAIGSYPVSSGTWLVTSCVALMIETVRGPGHRAVPAVAPGDVVHPVPAGSGRGAAAEQVTQQLHRHRDGPLPDRRPRSREDQRPPLAGVRADHAEVHGAHGLVRRPASGAGDARDPHPDGGSEPGPCTLRQRRGHLRAHRTVLGQQNAGDVEQLLLRRVPVCGDAAEHPPRRAGAGGQPRREQPARARLGGGDGESPVGQG